MRQSYLEDYIPTPAAHAGNQHLDDFSLPRPKGIEPTAFSNIHWRMEEVFEDGGLFQANNSRYCAAVRGGYEVINKEPRMVFKTYVGTYSNASTVFFAGTQPRYSSSWQKHNCIYTSSRDPKTHWLIMSIAAALAIMYRGGDIGDMEPPLYPVKLEEEYEPIYPNERITGFTSDRYPNAGVALTATAHLHPEVTNIKAIDYLKKSGHYVDMSMFGRASPNKTLYIEGLLAAAVLYMNTYSRPVLR